MILIVVGLSKLRHLTYIGQWARTEKNAIKNDKKKRINQIKIIKEVSMK
jgi:hypothetical protein